MGYQMPKLALSWSEPFDPQRYDPKGYNNPTKEKAPAGKAEADDNEGGSSLVFPVILCRRANDCLAPPRSAGLLYCRILAIVAGTIIEKLVPVDGGRQHQHDKRQFACDDCFCWQTNIFGPQY